MVNLKLIVPLDHYEKLLGFSLKLYLLIEMTHAIANVNRLPISSFFIFHHPHRFLLIYHENLSTTYAIMHTHFLEI